MGFFNFEGKYQKSRDFGLYKLYFTIGDLEELLTLLLLPHLRQYLKRIVFKQNV